LAQMEQKVVATEKAQDFSEQNMEVLEGKIEDSNSKLAVAINVVLT